MADKALKYHVPCRLCGSSDAASIYIDSFKDVEYSFCFSCNEKDYNVEVQATDSFVREEKPAPVVGGKILSIPERDLTRETADYYKVITREDGSFVFPYGPDAFKIRTKDKRFRVAGKIEQLFGQDRFPAGGKYVTVTEGEFDAMAAFQMMGSKYPVVSVPNGAAGAVKAVRDQFEWLTSFDTVVVCFDADEPGQKAAKQVCEVLGSKAKNVKLTKFKDANEYLTEQQSREFVDCWWRAEQYNPDGIVSGDSLWERLNTPRREADCSYPFSGINALTYGIRKGELVTVVAGSGLGKSQALREMQYHIFRNTQDNIGVLALEEGIEKSSLSMMSIEANLPLHLPGLEVTEDERKRYFDATLGTHRFFYFDHFGSIGIDNIVNRVRDMAKSKGCGYVFLDHVSIVVSSQEVGDERKALDEIMTKLRTLVQETGISLIIVSHLKRPEGKGHEEGAVTSLNQLRGSASIAQLSDIVIGLERDAQNDDPVKRNTTFFRVLKNRFSGLTGPAGQALYSLETGRMLDYIINEETL